MRKRPRTVELAGEREGRLRIGKLRLDAAPGLAARFELNAVPPDHLCRWRGESGTSKQKLACGARGRAQLDTARASRACFRCAAFISRSASALLGCAECRARRPPRLREREPGGILQVIAMDYPRERWLRGRGLLQSLP
jgi:hypothetical protein